MALAPLVTQRRQMRQIGGLDPVPGYLVQVRHAGRYLMAGCIVAGLSLSCHLVDPAVRPARNCFWASR